MEITAADIARKLGINPREARMKLRAAGIKAPYKPSDVAKMRTVIKGDKPAPKRKAKKASAPVAD